MRQTRDAMTWQLIERPRETLVICSVDTEEDDWEPRRDGVAVKNVEQLPRLSELMGEMNAPVTYFVTHAVAAHGASCRVLREVVDQGNSEIGAHLHPWNTPPLTESISPPNVMLNNLPASVQLSKLRQLTERLEDAFGRAPASFRAGRSALGSSTIDVIRQCGYTIDSSVMPFYDLSSVHGPTFVGAPNRAYCIGEHGDALVPLDAGPILEIPVSSGYSRVPFDLWDAIYRRLGSRLGRALRLPGLASRAGVLSKIALKPELESVSDMLKLSRTLIEQGASHLQIMWHSPSLLPGTSPFVRTPAERDRLLARIRGFIEGLRQTGPVRFVTLSEAARGLAREGPDRPVAPILHG
jgi:polysaccharide deacetylase